MSVDKNKNCLIFEKAKVLTVMILMNLSASMERL